jgi:hypothetical protein
VQGLGEWLVVLQDVKLPAVKHIPEMPDAEVGASSSLSNAEYFSWAVSNFLLKKESGLQPPLRPPPSCHCCRTTPICVLLASTAKLRSAAGLGG